jgi:hypothetical protein
MDPYPNPLPHKGVHAVFDGYGEGAHHPSCITRDSPAGTDDERRLRTS